MRFCTAVSSSKVARKSLDALSLLLRNVTMVFDTNTSGEERKNDEGNCSSFRRLKDDNYLSEYFKFIEKLETHASSPLSTLVQLIPVIKSTEVRKVGVGDFCKSILAITSSSTWKAVVAKRRSDNADYNNEVGNSALECSLILLGGDDNGVCYLIVIEKRIICRLQRYQ